MMVEQMGMSDVIGPRNIAAQQQNMFAGPQEGEMLKNKADDEVDRILDEQYQRGMQLLSDHKEVLDAIAKRLIEKEKIDGNEMLALIKEINPTLISEAAVKKVAEMVQPVKEAISDTLSDGGDTPVPA